VTVLFTHPIEQRRFKEWRMAYCGSATYADRHLEPLFSDPSTAAQIAEPLVALLEEYARMSVRQEAPAQKI
jgi:hypothetical protein